MKTFPLEQQIKCFTEKFEVLTQSILKSESPKNYSELFAFFETHLKPKQVFFWKIGGESDIEKTKFLSLKKTKLADFNLYKKQFNATNFNSQVNFFSHSELLLKIPGVQPKEFFCFYFINITAPVLDAELTRYVFTQRITGLVYLIEKLVQIQSLNFIDDVTNLYNQRYLNILLDQEIERFKRSSASFSVLFIDVDHFKNVNDINGHLVGSHILKEIGHILKKTVRAVDFCFRYGGDEFMAVLTNTTTDQALSVAKRICDTVAQTSFLVQSKAIRVTLSIGVASFPEHAQTKEKIIQVADEAMYCGKKSSRNIVYVAS